MKRLKNILLVVLPILIIVALPTSAVILTLDELMQLMSGDSVVVGALEQLHLV